MGSSPSSYHPAKFVGLVPCENKDEIFLICHVIDLLRDFVGGVASS